MTKGVLIVGSNNAALQAASDLADSNIPVLLIESSPFFGNKAQTSLTDYPQKTALLEIARHPNIHAYTNTDVIQITGIKGNYCAQLDMHPRYVDLEKCTACGDCFSVCPVNVPETDHKAIYMDGQPGCAIIQKAGISPCANACPGGINVQGYVALIAQRKFQEAIDLIRMAIPFPAICGRVCTHPCEMNCRRNEVDQPISIRLLKRFVSDWESSFLNSISPNLQIVPRIENPIANNLDRASSSRIKVAIVGSGPGGMTVAEFLSRAGYSVTVFEKLPVMGGMMAIGIPEYRLPSQIITKEYQNILDRGVEIQLNTFIGPGGAHTFEDLFSMGYSAICLAIGAHRSQKLGIPGENMTGVVQGLDLLKNISLSQQMNNSLYRSTLQQMLPRGAETRAVVLGGGNTAMDVSRSLKRLGLKNVRVLYRRTRNEMTALPEEIEDAEDEGVIIEYLISPVRVLGSEQQGVTGLQCVRMELGEPDASGRPRPVPIPGSEFDFDLDLIILAIGQSPDISILSEMKDITFTRAGVIDIEMGTYMTGHPGVFAVGDAVTTNSMAVIEAIGMAKNAAIAIDTYLRGKQLFDPISSIPVSKRIMSPAELVSKARVSPTVLPLHERTSSFQEVELGFNENQAVIEAQRCLACGICSECLECVRVCKPGAIIHRQNETSTEVDIGAVIYTTDAHSSCMDGVENSEGIICLTSEDSLYGSVAAARAMCVLVPNGFITQKCPTPTPLIAPTRTGVFICQCGDKIASAVDTNAVCNQSADLPGVVLTGVLSFACSPDAYAELQNAIRSHSLDRIVLSACSCCDQDQVCYSCTHQRIRCKDNMGIFREHHRFVENKSSTPTVKFEFVNIREQAAWLFASNPPMATARAIALTAATVKNTHAVYPVHDPVPLICRSILVMGKGKAGLICKEHLNSFGIAVEHISNFSMKIDQYHSPYSPYVENDTLHTSTIILAPRDKIEERNFFRSFDTSKPNSPPKLDIQNTIMIRPGIFYCDPSIDSEISGAAVASRVSAWLGNAERRASTSAMVDPSRCRACGTCSQICECGAPFLVDNGIQRYSWVDPYICAGCGTCAAHCPSGAILAGHPNAPQLEAMLYSLLG